MHVTKEGHEEAAESKHPAVRGAESASPKYASLQY